MSKTCCVDGCQITKEDVTYFPMPIKPGLLRKWRDAMGTSNVNNYSLICSAHFTQDDYEHVRGKLRLKAKVVPSVFGNQIPPPKSPENNKQETTTTNETNSQTKETKSKTIKKRTKRRKKKLSETETDSEEDDEVDDRIPVFGEDLMLDGCMDDDSQENCTIECEEDDAVDDRIPMFGEDLMLDGCMDDDSQENCTIECVPEAIIRQDSGTESEPELHKEDIEDIIANYHIKQDKKLAERLKPQEIEIEIPGTDKSDKQGSDKSDNQGSDKSDKQGSDKSDKQGSDLHSLDDCVEVSFRADDKSDEPVFVEISVGEAHNTDANSRDDCLMLLEDVQVDIDPATLLLCQEEREDDDDHRKEDPISLLTSSDESDVILEEPHIDTVEVSDETDEDDQPLVKLVKPPEKTETLSKILWGNLYEYYCMHCHFKTTNRAIYQTHKELHSTVIQMCEVCNFTSASKAQFARHRKKHKDEKKYKCHLCEYKAKHNMSLIYHLKSHESVSVKSLKINKKYKGYRCDKCKFSFRAKLDMLKHVRHCKTRMHACDKCDYATKRRSDLKRHKARRHEFDDVDDDDDYVPPPWAD